MTNILLGVTLMVIGALCTMTFVGIIVGIPLFALGFWLAIKGIASILWGVGKIGVSVGKAGYSVAKTKSDV